MASKDRWNLDQTYKERWCKGFFRPRRWKSLCWILEPEPEGISTRKMTDVRQREKLVK